MSCAVTVINLTQIFKMDTKTWKEWVRIISLFLFARYPIVNGLTFLMLLGERAKRETHPPIDPNIIYGHVGVFIAVGLAMGFNIQRKLAALVHVFQLIYLAFIIQTNEKLKYKDWLRTKICLRMLGTIGFFLLYAFFTSPKPRPQYLRRSGETFIGMYVACFMYQLLMEPKEKEAFLQHTLGGHISLYIFALLLAVCMLCYIPGFFVVDITQALLFGLWFFTLSVDCRIYYWTKRIGIDYWIQVRLIADHFAMMLGCLMYLTCTKKIMAVDGMPSSTETDDDGVEIIDQNPLEQPEQHAHPNPEEDLSETDTDSSNQTTQNKKDQ